MPTLPLDGDGILVPFDSAAVTALDLKRRGVRSEHDHVRYQLSPNGSSCTRKFSCAWDQRFNAAIYLAGAVVTYNDPGTGVRKLSRILPQTDPDYPNWVCTQVEIMPHRFVSNIYAADTEGDPIEDNNPGYDAGTHVPVFGRAELVATFEMVPFDLVSDDLISTEFDRYTTKPGYPGADVSAEANYIGLPGSALWYSTSDGTTATGPASVPIPFPVGFVEMSGKLRYIWRRLPVTLWDPSSALFQRVIGTETTRGYIGAVNKTLFNGYPPQSLQLIGIEQRLLPDPTGLGYSWDLTYIMAHAVKPFGHLGLYYHDTRPTGAQSGYYQAQRPAAGDTRIAAASLGDNDAMFHVREFSDLWKPGV